MNFILWSLIVKLISALPLVPHPYILLNGKTVSINAIVLDQIMPIHFQYLPYPVGGIPYY